MDVSTDYDYPPHYLSTSGKVFVKLYKFVLLLEDFKNFGA